MRRLYREYFGSEPPNLRVPTSGVSGFRNRPAAGGSFPAFPGKNGGSQVERFFFVEDEALDHFSPQLIMMVVYF